MVEFIFETQIYHDSTESHVMDHIVEIDYLSPYHKRQKLYGVCHIPFHVGISLVLLLTASEYRIDNNTSHVMH